MNRVTTFIQKRVRAQKIGVPLGRSKDFRLPEQISLNKKRVRVQFPDEQGVRVAFSELIFGDCYDLEQVKQPIKTVLDIGANVGIFALAARQAFPDATIHSYEPNPHLEQYLKVQTEAAHSQYYMEAVACKDGYVALNFHEDSVQTTSRVDAASSIPAVAFRKAVDRLGGSVDFVKVDCEGAEWQLWQDQGAWKNVKYLSTEYHIQDGHTHDEAYLTVTNLGFDVRRQIREETFGLIIAASRDAK